MNLVGRLFLIAANRYDLSVSVFGGASKDDHALATIFKWIEFGATVDRFDCKASDLQEQADFAVEEVAKGHGRDSTLDGAITTDFIVNPVDTEELLGTVKVADGVLHHEMAGIRF